MPAPSSTDEPLPLSAAWLARGSRLRANTRDGRYATGGFRRETLPETRAGGPCPPPAGAIRKE